MAGSRCRLRLVLLLDRHSCPEVLAVGIECNPSPTRPLLCLDFTQPLGSHDRSESFQESPPHLWARLTDHGISGLRLNNRESEGIRIVIYNDPGTTFYLLECAWQQPCLIRPSLLLRIKRGLGGLS